MPKRPASFLWKDEADKAEPLFMDVISVQVCRESLGYPIPLTIFLFYSTTNPPYNGNGYLFIITA